MWREESTFGGWGGGHEMLAADGAGDDEPQGLIGKTSKRDSSGGWRNGDAGVATSGQRMREGDGDGTYRRPSVAWLKASAITSTRR